MTWQPIDSAPKDGTVIDLYDSCFKKRYADAFWDGEFFISRKDAGWGSTFATHWMPLPDAPHP